MPLQQRPSLHADIAPLPSLRSAQSGRGWLAWKKWKY